MQVVFVFKSHNLNSISPWRGLVLGIFWTLKTEISFTFVVITDQRQAQSAQIVIDHWQSEKWSFQIKSSSLNSGEKKKRQKKGEDILTFITVSLHANEPLSSVLDRNIKKIKCSSSLRRVVYPTKQQMRTYYSKGRNGNRNLPTLPRFVSNFYSLAAPHHQHTEWARDVEEKNLNCFTEKKKKWEKEKKQARKRKQEV